jgi:hypothetical protein
MVGDVELTPANDELHSQMSGCPSTRTVVASVGGDFTSATLPLRFSPQNASANNAFVQGYL